MSLLGPGGPIRTTLAICPRSETTFSSLTLLLALTVPSLLAKMGQGGSKGPLSPLECLLKNFSDFRRRAGNHGTSGNAFDLRKFCELEWPTFTVGWPSEGTLDIGVAQLCRPSPMGTQGVPIRSHI